MNPYLTIGIAGHVDHGKTSLVRCLTGIETDRKPEEKTRGVSIDAGVAPLGDLSYGQIALVDVPGHTDYLKNTIRGLHAVDMAILVVAADDGIMPQTLEHLEILKFFQIGKGFAVLSKIDLVDMETREIALLEIEDALKGTFLEGGPIIPFSAQDQTGFQSIRNQILETAGGLKAKPSDAFFRLWIDQVRVLHGFGTVVSGTVLSGKLREGDMIQLHPAGIVARARSLESHGQKIERAHPGQRIGINLHKIPATEVGRGMTLTGPQSVSVSYLLNAELHLLSNAATTLKNRQRLKLYIGTSIINAMVVMMGRATLSPGEQGLVQFRLMKPAAAMPRDPFVVSPLNRNVVIGGGAILETVREKYRTAKSGDIVPGLAALQSGTLPAYLDLIFSQNQTRPFSAQDLAQKTGWSRLQLEQEINTRVKKGALVYIKGLGAISTDAFGRLKANVLQAVEGIFQRDTLKKSINEQEIANHPAVDLEEHLLHAITNDLCRDQKLLKGAGGIQNPLFNECLPPELSPEREKMTRLLLEHARQIGLSPFSADSFWKQHQQRMDKPEIQQMLEFLAARKQLIRLKDNRFLHPDAIEVIKARIKTAIETKGRITLKDSTEILGYGRWGGAPVFDYLDNIGFTLRIGDERIMRY